MDRMCCGNTCHHRSVTEIASDTVASVAAQVVASLAITTAKVSEAASRTAARAEETAAASAAASAGASAARIYRRHQKGLNLARARATIVGMLHWWAGSCCLFVMIVVLLFSFPPTMVVHSQCGRQKAPGWHSLKRALKIRSKRLSCTVTTAKPKSPNSIGCGHRYGLSQRPVREAAVEQRPQQQHHHQGIPYRQQHQQREYVRPRGVWPQCWGKQLQSGKLWWSVNLQWSIH